MGLTFSRKLKRGKIDFDLGSFCRALAKGIAKAILIATCSYGLFTGYRFITSSPNFNINKVNWTGNESLSTEDLNTWAGPITGKNIFQLDLNKVSQKLAQHPWVKTALVSRVFPQGLNIDLNERTPFARVQLDQIYVMDNYGILLGPEVGKFNKLPFVTGILAKNPKSGDNVANEEIIRGLKTMHYINLLSMFKKNPIDTVRISSKSRVTFITRNKNMKVHMRPGTVRESFKNLTLVLDTIEESEGDLSYIDLSFKNKIVVKHHKKVKRNSQKIEKI